MDLLSVDLEMLLEFTQEDSVRIGDQGSIKARCAPGLLLTVCATPPLPPPAHTHMLTWGHAAASATEPGHCCCPQPRSPAAPSALLAPRQRDNPTTRRP
jgi:hypothetical protein